MTSTSRTTLAFLAAAAIGTAALHLSARGGTSAPVILQIVPAAPTPSGSPQTLAVEGRDFQAGPAVVLARPDGGTVNLKEADIQGQSETYFRVTVLLDRDGTYALTITNRDGGISKPFSFEVKRDPQTVSPAIEDVTPHDLHKDANAQDLHVTGRAFALGLKARLTNPLGEDVTDVSVSKIMNNSFELKAVLAMAGDYELAVVNGNGAVSNVWRLTVQ